MNKKIFFSSNDNDNDDDDQINIVFMVNGHNNNGYDTSIFEKKAGLMEIQQKP